MARFLYAKVKIRGDRSLLCHAFGPWAIPLEKEEKSGVKGNDPTEWKRTVLMTNDRQLYLKPDYIFACLRDGARHIKKGRGSLQPLVASTLQILDELILLDRTVPAEDQLIYNDPTQPVYLDVRGVVNPASKGRNVRYRIAASPGWTTEFSCLWDATVVSRSEMEAVIRDAGALSGLADGRSIGMGRFSLVSFDVYTPPPGASSILA